MYRRSSLPRFIMPKCPEPSEKERIEAALKNVSAKTLVCQGCGNCGCMEPHGTYRRGITYEQDGKTVDDFIMVPVFYCLYCHYYHAFLTDFLIPFCSFTLLFVLRVLGIYLERPDGITVEKICSKYQISSRTLYTWKKRFISHYAELAASINLPPVSQESDGVVPSVPSDACEEPCPSLSPGSSQSPNKTAHPYLDARAILHDYMKTLLLIPDLTLTFFSRFGFSFLQGNHKKHLKHLPRPN